jgi:hypothetical protein
METNFGIQLAMANQKDTNGSDSKNPDDGGFVRRFHETERNSPTRRSGPCDQTNGGTRDGKHGTVERFWRQTAQLYDVKVENAVQDEV